MTILEPNDEFQKVVSQIGGMGKIKHTETLLENARQNLSEIKKTLRDLPNMQSAEKRRSAIVISAGPSVHRKESVRRILESNYKGTIIAVDASYAACVRQGLIPDYVVTLDPHPTRMVRWFGDKEYERHAREDDYFNRQDLDVEFRKNSVLKNLENIELVNKHGHLTKAIIASSAPENVVQRVNEAKFDKYWWNPLVDMPSAPDSITRKLYGINKLPAMNTGGNVGSASWVFASTILKSPKVALVGMDLGYFHDLPHRMTQTYYELASHLGTENGIEKYFCEFTFPLTGEKFYTDPTYYWYRHNFLQLVEKSPVQTFNCTEGGTLFSEQIKCIHLDDFLRT